MLCDGLSVCGHDTVVVAQRVTPPRLPRAFHGPLFVVPYVTLMPLNVSQRSDCDNPHPRLRVSVHSQDVVRAEALSASKSDELVRIERLGLARSDREWPLNDAQHPHFHVVRIALCTGYNRVRGIGRAW